MEKEQFRSVNDRIIGLEKHIYKVENFVEKVDNKVEKLDDKVTHIDDKHDSRYTEHVRLLAEMRADYRASKDSHDRLTDSIQELVKEMKTVKEKGDNDFQFLSEDIREIRKKFDDKTLSINMELEEKKMSNATLGVILGGVLVVIQVSIQVLAPLFFG